MRHSLYERRPDGKGILRMQVIDKSGFVQDNWSGTAIVTLAEYQGGNAIFLPPDTAIEELHPHLEQLSLIVIAFPASTDGRGFSLAAALRLAGYKGHLRAEGHILVDQFRAALRVGFDDIRISRAQADRNPHEQWRAVKHHAAYRNRLFKTEA